MNVILKLNLELLPIFDKKKINKYLFSPKFIKIFDIIFIDTNSFYIFYPTFISKS